ncbi:DNA-binding protein [Parapedobacter sp. SGR-10]|uniref:DNA-binding protein n=1 Tax=Parapedobacter sp. SGR-10 TaxID=2710879 RepID=UPI0013D165E3|nr:DNA-binding protein [Parapedobacter sp. SGR-10]NGF55404.1 DNA-binding protein [Parapedobacter sp. SGR-10]
MKDWFYRQIAVLTAIYDILLEIKHQHVRTHRPLEQRKRWTKQEVLDKLNMSESTYKRNLKNGLLHPIRLNGIDEYFEEDILMALEESRRRGRI